MALTLESEQRLNSVGLIGFFDDNQARWLEFAEHSYEYVKANFPAGTAARPDDVAKVLVPLLEVDPQLTERLAQKRLKQKYWVRYFGDLILDRCWDLIAADGQGENQ